jgi:hypothetical protein
MAETLLDLSRRKMLNYLTATDPDAYKLSYMDLYRKYLGARAGYHSDEIALYPISSIEKVFWGDALNTKSDAEYAFYIGEGIAPGSIDDMERKWWEAQL